MEKINVQNSRYYQYLLDDKNIYLAVYSLESYVFEHGLLSLEDKIKFLKLKDKFNEEYILETIIPEIRKEIKRLIAEEDYYIPVQIYFNPKKYEDGRVEFRPIHTAGLLYQMVIVAMLNLLIYEVPLDEEKQRLRLSNLSRLIPGNFYGNRVSLKPKELFKPWKKQYQKYTSLTNEYLKKYHSSLEYKYEVTLDLEKFFPSVNPQFIIHYIMERLPIDLKDEDRELYHIILKKLLYCKVENDLCEQLWKNYYFDKSEISEDEERELKLFKKFSKGIPQGLPQSYFMGNIAMIPIAKEFNEQFPGVSLFYVDDSVIFTNELCEDKFVQSLESLNHRLEKVFKSERLEADSIYPKALIHLEKYYKIKVHQDKKSYYTRLDYADNGEVFLMCLSREVSHVASDMFQLYSNEEDNNLKEKLRILSEQIQKKMGELLNKIENTDKTKDIEGYQKMMQRLTRYYKFFRYRFILLDLMETEGTEELEHIVFMREIDKELVSLEYFIDSYKNNIWGAAVSIYARQLTDDSDINALKEYIKEINSRIFEYDNRTSSYLYRVYTGILDERKDLDKFNLDPYASLKKMVNRNLANYQRKHSHVIEAYIKKLEQQKRKEILRQIISKSLYNSMVIVDANTEEIFRMVLNTIYSYLFSVEIEDSFIIRKRNHKPVVYGELRILIFLRNAKFTEADFFKQGFLLDTHENQMPIDYSILEVTEIFRTFVGSPVPIDNLIQTHQYIYDLWRNGSKYLYFYTLHNQEHAIELIKNCIKIIHTFDYFQISAMDYYILFLACYLHDIAMVWIPPFEQFLLDQDWADKIALDLEARIKELRKDEESYELGGLKKMIVEIYQNVDQFFEKQVRNNHAFNSAQEIRDIKDLHYLDDCLREFVAEIAEAHAHCTSDVYFVKSDAKNKLISTKFNKILLRLADVLDISMYRISKPILNRNLNQMPRESAFHWISHLMIKGYALEVNYKDKTENCEGENEAQLLSPGSITEKVTLRVMVEMTQLSKYRTDKPCSFAALNTCEFTPGKKYLELNFGEECQSKENCNFLCRWFVSKNKDLLWELGALARYLKRTPDNFFDSEISVRIEMVESTVLDAEEFELLEKYLDEDASENKMA